MLNEGSSTRALTTQSIALSNTIKDMARKIDHMEKTVHALKPLAEAMEKLTADGTKPQNKKADGGTSEPNQHTIHCSSRGMLAMVGDVHCTTSLNGPDALHC